MNATGLSGLTGLTGLTGLSGLSGLVGQPGGRILAGVLCGLALQCAVASPIEISFSGSAGENSKLSYAFEGSSFTEFNIDVKKNDSAKSVVDKIESIFALWNGLAVHKYTIERTTEVDPNGIAPTVYRIKISPDAATQTADFTKVSETGAVPTGLGETHNATEKAPAKSSVSLLPGVGTPSGQEIDWTLTVYAADGSMDTFVNGTPDLSDPSAVLMPFLDDLSAIGLDVALDSNTLSLISSDNRYFGLQSSAVPWLVPVVTDALLVPEPSAFLMVAFGLLLMPAAARGRSNRPEPFRSMQRIRDKRDSTLER